MHEETNSYIDLTALIYIESTEKVRIGNCFCMLSTEKLVINGILELKQFEPHEVFKVVAVIYDENNRPIKILTRSWDEEKPTSCRDAFSIYDWSSDLRLLNSATRIELFPVTYKVK